MCKPIKWDLVKPSKVHALLSGFPRCGVRYKTDERGDGIVLVLESVRNQLLVKQKIAAARIKATREVYVVEVPNRMAAVYGLVPTLTVRA